MSKGDTMRRIFSNLAIARKIAIVSGTILAIFLVAVAITNLSGWIPSAANR